MILKTYMDSNLVLEIISRLKNRDDEDFDTYYTLDKFIKQETHFILISNPEQNQRFDFIRYFTGRGRGTNVGFEIRNTLKEYKGEFNNGASGCVYFINENDVDKRKRILRKNQSIIAFNDNMIEIWTRISFNGKDYHNLNFRQNSTSSFNSWSEFSEYIIPNQEYVIIDSFLLSDPSLVESNLIELVKSLHDRLDSKPLNITLISSTNCFEKNSTILNDDLIKQKHLELKQLILNKNLQVKLNLIMFKQIAKEHDRHIISEYNLLNSGTSFNYFKSNGKKLEKSDTTISIFSFTSSSNAILANELLDSVKAKINENKNTFFSHYEFKSKLLK